MFVEFTNPKSVDLSHITTFYNKISTSHIWKLLYCPLELIYHQ